MAERAGSRYAAKQKAGLVPHRYSELYRQWREARAKGDHQLADRLGRQHTVRFIGVRGRGDGE